jgi:two-component system, LytTR family, response regulator LytT
MSVRALIIEDEEIAALALRNLLGEADPGITVLGVMQSIDESVSWFESNPMPDLVFMDIQLADGLSFSIFEETRITCPVIFTTAYDQYAIKAFDVNSVGYLLKPVSIAPLQRALERFRTQQKSGNIAEGSVLSPEILDTLMKAVRGEQTYRRHFLISSKDKLIPLSVDKISCFYTELRVVKVVTTEGRAHAIDQTLDDLMKVLDPRHFFRANRQYIIRHESIKEISIWFNGKLTVTLNVQIPEKIIIPRARTGEFRIWYGENG